MTFMEYVEKNLILREEVARTRPFAYFGLEAGRHAMGMALVLTLIDLTPWTPPFDAPWARLRFIAGWSVLMAVWSLCRVRYVKAAIHRSLPPAS